MMPGQFSWVQVGFYGFFTIPGWFFMVPGSFSWFLWFKVWLSWFQVDFYRHYQVGLNPSWAPEVQSETLRTPQKVPAWLYPCPGFGLFWIFKYCWHRLARLIIMSLFDWDAYICIWSRLFDRQGQWRRKRWNRWGSSGISTTRSKKKHSLWSVNYSAHFQHETLTTNEILACARNLQKDLLEAESFNYRSGNKSKLQ